jgi:hypothetical protein
MTGTFKVNLQDPLPSTADPVQDMIPLWDTRFCNTHHPKGYWPPLDACIEFILRHAVGFGGDPILSGYTTSVQWRGPDGATDKLEPLVVERRRSRNTQDWQVYTLKEISSWRLHKCEAGKHDEPAKA